MVQSFPRVFFLVDTVLLSERGDRPNGANTTLYDREIEDFFIFRLLGVIVSGRLSRPRCSRRRRSSSGRR